MARLNKDHIDKWYDNDLYLPTRTIYLGSTQLDIEAGESGTDAFMAERLIKALHLLEQTEEPIHIITNNPGGDFYDGLGIYDTIKASKNHITMKVIGKCMSAGAMILQAADERIMTSNSRLMIHYGTLTLDTESMNAVRWADEEKRTQALTEDILLERILEKNPNFKRNQLKKMLNPDTILTAAESLAYGLIDKIME